MDNQEQLKAENENLKSLCKDMIRHIERSRKTDCDPGNWGVDKHYALRFDVITASVNDQINLKVETDGVYRTTVTTSEITENTMQWYDEEEQRIEALLERHRESRREYINRNNLNK